VSLAKAASDLMENKITFDNFMDIASKATDTLIKFREAHSQSNGIPGKNQKGLKSLKAIADAALLIESIADVKSVSKINTSLLSDDEKKKMYSILLTGRVSNFIGSIIDFSGDMVVDPATQLSLDAAEAFRDAMGSVLTIHVANLKAEFRYETVANQAIASAQFNMAKALIPLTNTVKLLDDSKAKKEPEKQETILDQKIMIAELIALGKYDEARRAAIDNYGKVDAEIERAISQHTEQLNKMIPVVNAKTIYVKASALQAMNDRVSKITNSNFSSVGSPARYFQGNAAANKAAYDQLRVAQLKIATVQESSYVNGQIIKAPVDVVLTWGANPSDLDSHLTGPTGSSTNPNERFHTYFAQRGSLNTTPNAMLYKDDTSSYGPEQTRINVVNPGVYRFYVHDFSNRGATGSTALAGSGASVAVHQSGDRNLSEGSNLGAKVAQVDVPTGRTGNTWQAFELDSRTGVLNKTNEFRDISDPANVPFNQ
jgi:hypothetical protein